MTMPTFRQVANNAQSTLAADINNAVTSISVATGHGSRFPTPGNGFLATIWDADAYADPFGDPSMEVVLVTARSGDTLTVTRGQRGTSGASHLTGHAIRLLLDSTHISDLQACVGSNMGWRLFDDFLDQSSASNTNPTVAGWMLFASGSGSGAGTAGSGFIESGRPGVKYLNTGTTNSGIAGMELQPNCVILGGGVTWAEAAINLGNLSTGSDEYVFRFGLGDQGTSDQVDGVYFEYDRTASVNWRMCAASNSTRTRTASSTAVATGWVKLRVEIDAAASTATYYVNGASIGTVSTNIPTGANRNTGFLLHIIKTAGTTDRYVLVDYIACGQVLTTVR